MNDYRIREARAEDAPFIAWTIITALGKDAPSEQLLRDTERLCSRDDTLYSWKNTMVAELDSQSVGALTCYDGALYLKMRAVTFPLIAQLSGNDYSTMESETAAGEFYLDSMAVRPQYRNRGVATSLLKAGIQRARNLNIPQASMVVSPLNPRAQQLYESLGFRHQRDLFLFGETYRKMILDINL